MGLFDAIKDAFTTDDGERLDAAQKELARLQDQLQGAKNRNDINAIADIQGRIEAAEGQIRDLQAKLGQAPAAPVDAPVDPVTEPAVVEEPVVEAPVAEEPVVAPEPEPTPVAEPAAPVERTYTVKPGDTLSKIGREFGVTYQSIAELNNIENPDLIYPGQVFRIPNS